MVADPTARWRVAEGAKLSSRASTRAPPTALRAPRRRRGRRPPSCARRSSSSRPASTPSTDRACWSSYFHISKEEQRERLQSRLDTPAKHWKFAAGDLDERRLWPKYQRAFRDWAVLTILTETLRQMDPQYPPAAEDLAGVVIPE